jgi:hypothetical protein
MLLLSLTSHFTLDQTELVKGIVVLTALALGAAYMAWIGYGLFRGSRVLKNPLEAAAIVNKLYETRGCWADVTFTDAAGVQRSTTIPVMQKIWKYLKESGTISISYEAANPLQARYGGQAAQSVYAVSGLALMAIGSALSLLFVVLLIVGWVGSMNPKEPARRHRGTSTQPDFVMPEIPKPPKMPELPQEPPQPPAPPNQD